MWKSVGAGLVLCAVLAGGKAQAYVNYLVHHRRHQSLDCVFSSREQCAQDGRNRGFGG
jgi:hypothetical protein